MNKVTPKTSAGLSLADVPCNGLQDQKRNTTCVFKGVGTILKTQDIVIDYDTWTDQYNLKLGKIKYRNCLVKCDAGEGWAGEGALIKL